MQTIQSESKLCWLLVIALWSLALLPWLLGHGIFVDGLYYGTMSRNWYFEGENFWDFKLSKTVLNQFSSHPPLAFWMQAALFGLLGDYWWVDRFYSLLLWGSTALGIVFIWKIYFKHNAWLPLFIWLLFPTVSWSYSNNILENTMALFTTWAVFFILKSQHSKNLEFLFLAIAGLFVFAAFMSKGPVGLFPLGLPFILLIWDRSFKLMFLALMPILTAVAAFLLLIFSNENALEFFQLYWGIQLEGSFKIGPEDSNHFVIIIRLLIETSPLIGLYLLMRWRRKAKSPVFNKEVGLFLLLASSASLPMLISPKQMGFYLFPSFPFWAIGFALLFKPLLETIRIKTTKFAFLLPLLMFFTALTWMLFNNNSAVRDRLLIEDIRKMCQLIPLGSEIGNDPELGENWQMHGYFARYGKLSLHSIGHPAYKFHIAESKKVHPSIGCRVLFKGLSGIGLYECPKPE